MVFLFELLARSIDAINHHSNWESYIAFNVHRPSYDFSPPIEYGFGVREPGRVDIAGAPQLCFLFYNPPLNIEY